MTGPALDFATLAQSYADGSLDPETVLRRIVDRIAAQGTRPVWITLVAEDRLFAHLSELRAKAAAGERLPLFGVPFAVKDNIDVAGLPTTAACPDFAYVPDQSATVVERLEAAGAILIGKTNLDQFATGLVGTRSPYGVCSSVFDKDYVSGGSSSGSAVAVASGLVAFALGTDTAGSGRVPAAFNNIVGLKPTKGLVSARGVVPACRTLDCVSIFAGTVGDAVAVMEIAAGFDAEDAYSRHSINQRADWNPEGAVRLGVPTDGLEFFGDDAAASLFAAAVERARSLGATIVVFDYAPFRRAAQLLYQGPWVAERLAAIRSYGFEPSGKMDPTVRAIIEGAARVSAADAFDGMYALAEAQRAAEAEWAKMDAMLLPTAGTIYRIDQVLADPIALNANLGVYTNFVNLLDLCATAVPAGFRPNGSPFGVTLIGRAFQDREVAILADRMHRALPGAKIGASDRPVDAAGAPMHRAAAAGTIALAVVGAHLTGQPLNWQLTSRKAELVCTTHTASGYSLYALAGTVPAKPGLIRDGGRGGIEVEIWELDEAGFGSFVSQIPPPLGIGTLMLEDASQVKGFLCEPYAAAGAEDITVFGGWRNWLASRAGA